MNTPQQRLQAIAQLIKKNAYRPAMQVINFIGTEAVATDGYILARTPLESEPMKLAGLSIAKMKKGDILSLEEKKIVNTATITTINQLEIEYPRYEQVIPHDNNHLVLGLSLEVLESVVKIMKKNQDNHIKLSFSDNNLQPIKGELKDIELAIMPYRIND